MLIAQYAGIGNTCPLFEIEVNSGGTLTLGGTLYFSCQLQNRAGFNIPSVSGAIAYSPSQDIAITIPDSIRKDGWDIHYFVISAGATSDPSTHVQIARIPNYQYGEGIDPQSLQTELPFTLELTKDEHLKLAPSIATLANFPTGADRLDGQARFVTAESKWFEYRADSDLTPSVDVIVADIGQWVRIGGASTYVSNTRLGVGCDRPIASINPATTIPTPPYPGETLGKYLPSWEARYWIYNDNSNPVPAGTEFGIELEYNNKRSPNLLNGLFMVKFIGFVGTDGEIRTTDADGLEFKNVGAYFSWTPKVSTPFITSDDLQPGEAIALAIKPFFAPGELDDGSSSITPKSIVGVFPVTRTQSGDFNPVGKILKNAVYNIDDQYRVVPNTGLSFDILAGTAIIGSYDFPAKPRRVFGGLLPDTAGQKIIINGNSAVYAEIAAYTPTASEDIRAIASTAEGESTSGAWSSYSAIASGQSIQLTLTYPCDADGYGVIRSDYPDVIAGSTKGFFNPARVNIYLQRQDTLEIRRFSGSLVVAGISQIITLTAWTSGTIVPDLPTAGEDFSLFAPSVVAIAPSTGGSFPVTSYRAAYSFEYDGNQITKISHASPPCIPELPGGLIPEIEVNPDITILPNGSPATVTNTGVGGNSYLTFSLPIADADFDKILVDSSGSILVDANGNVLSI
ncbi:hypothetical protein H6G36_25675 [Anabaena minutissima FACHB-250]|nr:hypothetical protein [Anabaena minutissima FACHB-250]